MRTAASGKVWSEDPMTLRFSADVEASARLAAEIHQESLVQAIIEAETAAQRLGPKRRPTGSAEESVAEKQGAEEAHVSECGYTSVRVGDAVAVEIAARTHGNLHMQVHLCKH